MARRAFSNPITLLLLVTALFSFLIQSGELGTSDSTHRLQVTHSLWTGEPQVFPDEYPDFGVHGRGGRLYATYGIGQSLLMLPADLAGTAASHLPLWRRYVNSEADPTIRSIFVSISTNVLVNVLTALAAYRLLSLLGFSMRESIVGALGLLVATTHLHYAQNMTENNYILLLTITGFALQYRWLTTGDQRSLWWGSIALGLNLLTRITTVLDVLGAACFLLFATLFARHKVQPATNTDSGSSRAATAVAGNVSVRVRIYLRTALPVYAFFLLLDRAYQYLRFDSWTNTYVGVQALEQRRMNPALPSNYPFEGHWFQGGLNSGMLGPLFAPEKSIFLFDTMFPLTLLLSVLLWKRLAPGVRAFLAACLVLLTAYLAFYARYDSWAGDFAWGDRYISSTVELTSLLAIPILVSYWKHLRRPIRYFAIAITASSVAIQCASVAFWLPLEIYQMETFGHHTWVVLLRFKNIAAFAMDRWDAWGLNTPAIYQDPWDAAHLTTLNFLPSLLHHIGVASLWTVRVLFGVWFGLAVALVFLSVRLVNILFDPATSGGNSEVSR
jgi:hypothetical protein